MTDQRQCLQRLAQTHVVGQDPAQAGLPEERHPLQARALVRAQLGLQTRWDDLGQPVEVT
jgi:hypothetical protein